MPILSRFAPFALTALASVALVAPAAAQDDAVAQFQGRYTALRTAMETRDAAAVARFFAPEYTMTDLRGETRSGTDVLARMQKMGARASDPARKIETTVLSATIAGDSATVEQQLTGGGKRAGEDGVEHTMELVMKSTDTWVKRGDVWQIAKSVQTGMIVKRDGEVFFQDGK